MFAKLQKELAPQSVAVVPVAFDDPAKVKSFLENKKLEISTWVDQDGLVAARFGAHLLPKTFVIDGDGVVAKAFLNRLSETELRKALASLGR